MTTHFDVRNIAIAIYTVNRHAKTATDKKHLYMLKNLSLEKLLRENHAKKIGLHFVNNPKRSKQHSMTLVSCEDFLFHMIPTKEDFNTLPHLGQQNEVVRNPKERMSIRTAKETLSKYIGKAIDPSVKQDRVNRRQSRPSREPTSFRSSYLDGIRKR